MEETELINRLQTGDESAFRSVVDEYQASVLNCCYKFVKNKETAEDITQEVFIVAYKSINNFRAESKLSTWLVRIAISKSLDYLKSIKRGKRLGYLMSVFKGDGNEEYISATDLRTPQHLLENEERVKVISWALESLPENQKIAFTLCKSEGMNYKEIAEILDTTVSSIESLIFRAKTNLKKKLYKYYKKHL